MNHMFYIYDPLREIYGVPTFSQDDHTSSVIFARGWIANILSPIEIFTLINGSIVQLDYGEDDVTDNDNTQTNEDLDNHQNTDCLFEISSVSDTRMQGAESIIM